MGPRIRAFVPFLFLVGSNLSIAGWSPPVNPAIVRTTISVDTISPDWGWYDSSTTVVIAGSFPMIPGCVVQSSTISLTGPSGILSLLTGTSHTTTEVTVTIPTLSVVDEYCMTITLTVAPAAGWSAFDVTAPERPCFQVSPRFSSITGVNVFYGPPSGGTIATFDFSMLPLAAFDLACSFGTVQVPLVYSVPTTGSVHGSCESPVIGGDQFVCVQLLPRGASSLPLPSVQDISGSNCHATDSFLFNYYEQMPLLTALSMTVGPYTGGTVVSVTGFNFPSTRASSGTVLCRFGSTVTGIVPAVRTSASVVTCEPAPTLADTGGTKGADNHFTVPVSVSFNSGENFSSSTKLFTFVPIASPSVMSPAHGLRNGGTVTKVTVSYTSATVAGLPVTGPTGICVDSLQVLADSISADLSELTVTMPAASAVFTSVPSLPLTIDLFLIQADGTCGTDSTPWTYHKEWTATSVSPGLITGGASMSISVVGTDFYSSVDTACKAVAAWPVGSLTETTFVSTPCEATGALTVSTSSEAVCEINLARSLYDCGYEAASTVLNEDLLWDSMTLNLALSMNGVDYVPVIRTSDSLPAPILAVRAPIVRAVSPAFGFDYGGFVVEIFLETGVAWQASACVFTSSARTVQVPAMPYSMRSVACFAPPWPLGVSADTETVTVVVLVSGTIQSNAVDFDFVKSPVVSFFGPHEGPLSGNTRVTIVGSGFAVLSGVQCVFSKTQVVPAVVLSDALVECVTPAAVAAGAVTLDISINWQTDARLASMSVLSALFVYRDVSVSVSAISLLAGPVTGGSSVLITLTNPVTNNGLLRCFFDRTAVVPERKSDTEYACATPAVPSPRTAHLRFSTDAQSRLDFYFYNPIGSAAGGSTGAAEFEYYWAPSVAGTVPAYGSAVGGTQLLIQGAHFLDSPDLSCKFADTIVVADLYISAQLMVCTTPGGNLGTIGVSVSNNGVDFTTAATDIFSYIEAQPLLVMTPFLGPISGGTRVTIRPAAGSLPAGSLATVEGIRCQFGTASVAALEVHANNDTIVCLTPAVDTAGLRAVTVFFNGLEPAFLSQDFLFHELPTVDSVNPPMGPQGLPNTVTIIGTSFVNSEFLTVRFGTDNVGKADVVGLWISETEIRCSPPANSPSPSYLRLPVMVSNNGQDFVPASIASWDPDDDSFETKGVVRYYTFHVPVVLRSVSPAVADFRGGNFVSVHGGPFLNTAWLACGFDRIVSVTATPIFVSSTHILCPVPNMLAADAAVAASAALQVALVANRWSDSYIDFAFTFATSPGAYMPYLSGQAVSCQPGFACQLSGLSEPLPCPPGTYQPLPGQFQCLPCPVGFYCPHSALTTPALCPGGWVCDEENLVVAYKRCPGGFVCVAGTATLDPIPDEPFTALTPFVGGTNAPYRCLQGMFCLEGTAAIVSILGNFSTPQPCYQGAYCAPGSASPFGAGAAPLGRFAPVPKMPGLLCPSRYFCGPSTGNIEPRPCPSGTYNGLQGQHNCTLAYEGSVAPAPLMASPIQSDCGYVAGRKGIATLTETDLCPPAMVCGFGVASDSEPPICVPAAVATDCDASAGQSFVAAAAGRTRLTNSQAYCCWSSARVVEWARRIESIFEAFPAGERLLALAARRFRQRMQYDATTGYVLLETVNRASLITTFDVTIAKVRDRIMFEIERSFSFKAPDACAPGVYCYRGTCAGLTPVESASSQR